MSYLFSGILDDYEDNFLFSPSNKDNGNIPSFLSNLQDIKDTYHPNDDIQSKVQDNFNNKKAPLNFIEDDKSNNLSEFHNIALDEGNELNLDNCQPAYNDADNYCKDILNEENQHKENSSTNPSSKKGKNQISNRYKFKTQKKQKNLPSYWRFDMVKKHWKSHINDYGKEIINEEIKKSDLPNELKKLIHKPDSLKFTANITVSDNYKFLGLSLREVFTLGKKTEKLPKQNDEYISLIFNYFEMIGNDNLSESMKKIKSFFEMSYENLIKMFYDSPNFIEFKNDSKTKFYDDGTKAQEGFSLLEKYSLVNLFKMLQKKRKRNE